jgi:DNA-binding GntR family transcriptional regulator
MGAAPVGCQPGAEGERVTDPVADAVAAALATDQAPSAPADLVTRCYLGIRDGIVRRRFLPGERLAPADLAREFGVSRTPVHFALKRLALEGLVVIEPRRGTVVRRVSARDVAEVAEVRTLIEVHAAAVAVRRVNPAALAALQGLVARLDEILDSDDRPPPFEAWSTANARLHRSLVRLAGNEALLRVYDGLSLGKQDLLVFAGWGVAPLREFQAQHRLMLQHLGARDAPALQEVLRTHIEQATSRALAILQLVGGRL